MELSNLIPDRYKFNSDWTIRKKFVMFKKIEHIPIAFIEDDLVYVFLDVRVSKEIIRLVKHLLKLNVEFYFTSPELSNPKGVEENDFKNVVIYHYLKSYSNKNFYYKFLQLEGFDFIQNMVSWCKKENCFDLIKSNYDSINKKVSRKYHDYYANKDYYEYDETIREEFRTLYRDIQISLVL